LGLWILLPSRGVRRQYSSSMRKPKGIHRSCACRSAAGYSRATVRPHNEQRRRDRKPCDSLLPDSHSGPEADLAYQWKWYCPNREIGHLCACRLLRSCAYDARRRGEEPLTQTRLLTSSRTSLRLEDLVKLDTGKPSRNTGTTCDGRPLGRHTGSLRMEGTLATSSYQPR
jgi:hypothetical protein